MKLTDFDIYSSLLKEKSGLVLTEDKVYLIESRLNPIAKKWGYNSLESMTIALQGVPDKNLITDIVEAMTTNETSFFRDTRPFDMFKDHLLTYMKEARSTRRRVRIWCAAASSGQEPYTLAMLIKEAAAEYPGWTFEIIATDISNDILDQAREGLYTQFEVQRGLPIQLLMKYFTQTDDQKWQINDDVKSMVKYEYLNLLEPMTRLGTFDIIFCRNVLIYFDEETKGEVLGRMSKQLENDGFLMLGGAETVIRITEEFVSIRDKRGVYATKNSPHLLTDTDKGAQLSSPAPAAAPITAPSSVSPLGTPPKTNTTTGN